jgi:uncharacterized protein (TIGR04255 family)
MPEFSALGGTHSSTLLRIRHLRVDTVSFDQYGTLLERSAVFGIDAPPRYRLARPPLVQAIAQVRFPVRAHLQSLEGVAPIQDRLGDLFPYLAEQNVQAVSLQLSAGAAIQAEGETAKSWRFTDDVGWTLSLAPDNSALSVGPQYGAFEEFSGRFRSILEALAEAAGVTRSDRLGLRYIDIAEIADARAPNSWREWFRPELTGWSATDVVGADTSLFVSLTQTQLSARPVGELSASPVDVQGIVRHGYIPKNTTVPGLAPDQQRGPGFLLDMDVFVEAPQAFDVDVLSAQLDMLHGQIDRFFRWTLAPAGEAYFGVEETG